MSEDSDIRNSYLSIRKTIGILGISLPLIVLISHGELLPSISHYYYTEASVFFIGILTAFGLFLISYKGYEKDPLKRDWVNDNVITLFGGIFILIVVLIPTACQTQIAQEIRLDCQTGSLQLYGHNCTTLGTIHLISAALFLASMGYLSFNRFSRSDSFRTFYRACGVIVWICVLLLIIRFLRGKPFVDYDVYFLETIAVVAFGASWLVKGEVLEGMGLVKNRS